jgi:hypothetical protein
LVIADLTGRNPNVFYELGIAHAFARPLISIADSQSSLPFDTKDERIIELGEYSSAGLTYTQGEQAKAALQESLSIVLSDGYVPPSPLRELAANASVDRLAPENPIAAELAQVREYLEEMRQLMRLQDPLDYRNLAIKMDLSNDRVQAELASIRAAQAEISARLLPSNRPEFGSASSKFEGDRNFFLDSILDFLKSREIRPMQVNPEGDDVLMLEIDEALSKERLREAFSDLAERAQIMIVVKGLPFEDQESFGFTRPPKPSS